MCFVLLHFVKEVESLTSHMTADAEIVLIKHARNGLMTLLHEFYQHAYEMGLV